MRNLWVGRSFTLLFAWVNQHQSVCLVSDHPLQRLQTQSEARCPPESPGPTFSPSSCTEW